MSYHPNPQIDINISIPFSIERGDSYINEQGEDVVYVEDSKKIDQNKALDMMINNNSSQSNQRAEVLQRVYSDGIFFF